MIVKLLFAAKASEAETFLPPLEMSVRLDMAQCEINERLHQGYWLVNMSVVLADGSAYSMQGGAAAPWCNTCAYVPGTGPEPGHILPYCSRCGHAPDGSEMPEEARASTWEQMPVCADDIRPLTVEAKEKT